MVVFLQGGYLLHEIQLFLSDMIQLVFLWFKDLDTKFSWAAYYFPDGVGTMKSHF